MRKIRRSLGRIRLVRTILGIYGEVSLILVYTIPLIKRADSARCKFVVLAQSRSGTRLLRDLINCHLDVHCDATIFDNHIPRFLFPK